MSQIILNWLNEQIQLSKRINNFQQDFNNGYLLGQLLSKYNQQLNFSEFLDKDDKKSKLKNFQLLFDTFASLKVTFNSSIANQIINKKSGVAKKLLYQLKMNLQKTSSNAFTKMTKMTKTLSPLKKIKVSKQQYDKVDKQHFVKQLNQLHPAQKSLNQQKLLKKFSDFHQKQIVVNNQLAQKQYELKLSQQKKFRQRQRDNLKKTADFRNQWEKSNVEKWSANMTVRHMQNQKDQMFKTKLQQTKFQNKTMSQLNAIKSLDKDINDFQKKFLKGSNKKKNIIDDSDESDDQVTNNAISEQPQLKKHESKLSSKLKFTSTNNPQLTFDSPSKKKKSNQVPQQQKHQRQKKRRKMIVQQNKRYQLIEISRRQKYILSTIQQTSKQEKQLEYQIWRVWQNKQIIKQNKSLEEQKINQKNQVRQINAKFKRDQLLKSYREEHQVEVNQAALRQDKLMKDHQVSMRKGIYKECKNIVQQFIQVAQKCFLTQQQKNQSQINQDLLDHLFSQFVQGSQTKEDIAKLELNNYINGRGEWNLPVKRKSQDQPTDPTLDNALPNKVTNNYVLGNILRLLYQNKYKNKTQSKSIQISQSSQQPKSAQYIFSLLGLEYSGKHLAAQALSKKHHFNIIQIQKLILKKLQQYEQIKDKVSQISQTTKKLVDLTYQGQNIPNQLIIQLIKQQVNKNPKSILLNFPTSYNQALQLTKTLSGLQPSDFIKKSTLQQKINSFSRLVKPTQSKTVPKPIKQCGVDLALWIDINNKTSYDRFLGRRWINNQVVHISDDIADHVNSLEVRDKASPQIYKNYQKLVQKNKLQQFFNQFGIQLNKKQGNPQNQQVEQFREGQRTQQQNELTRPKLQQPKIMKSWGIIDGHCSIQKLQEQVLNRFEQAMQFKNSKKEQQKQERQKKLQQQKKNEQKLKQQQQTKLKCVYSNQELIQQKLKQALDSISLDQQFVSQQCSIWESIESSTIQSLTNAFLFIYNQQKEQSNYFSSIKRNFINLLTRQDKKFSLVKQFQIKYNQFYQDNKQMISQEYTKQELHQRVDDLQETLFDIIQTKKQDAIEQKKYTLQSGWIESQLQQFYNCIRILLQAQLNRYNASQKILSDFYSKKYAVPQQPYQQTSTQIQYDSSLQMVTKQGACPRLQKLVSQAMRLFNREQEVVDDKNKKGGKAPPAKKDDKKGGKKNQVQQVKQPTAEQLELKRAINIEKSIFRYRVSIINEFSIRKILGMTKSNQNLYKDLESYYQYTYEIENKCVYNLSKIFRSNIQRQEKIENEVEVNYVDIIENEMIRNYQKQKPIILSAKEWVKQDRFTIGNIWEIIKLIENQSESKQKISTKRLLQLFKYLQINQNEKQILPSTWKQLNLTQIQHFVIKLDTQHLGFIQLWKALLFIVMTNYSIPSSKQLQNYFNQLTTFGTQLQITQQKIIHTKAWFDQQYQSEINTRTFKKNQYIKSILFYIFKRSNNNSQILNAEHFVSSLGLNWWKYQSNQNSYYSVAFGV